MENHVKVSVILPVYNVGPYIGKCLDTLRSQTLKELEFILVDDKSLDESLDMVKDLAEEDPRIRIITNQKNLGPGPSRNRGIEAAHGEYLSFVDPDDYLAPEYYEILYKAAKDKNTDIVKGYCVAVDHEGNADESWWSCDTRFKTAEEQGLPLFYTFVNEHFTGLYRRELFTVYPDLRYGDSRIGEDSVFLLRLCVKEPSIVVEDDAVYYHLIRSDSLDAATSFDAIEEGLKAYEKRIEILQEASMPEGSYMYIRSNLGHYSIRFKRYYQACASQEEKTKNRRLFIDEVNRILSVLPDPEEITRGYDLYNEVLELEKASTQGYEPTTSENGSGWKKKSFPARVKRKLRRLMRPR